MRKLPLQTLLILALCALLLAGCGGKTETVKIPQESPAAAPEAAAQPQAAAAPSVVAPSFDEQKALLEKNRDKWAFTDPYDSPWYYTFVDLDHNGRLEVIAATTQGSGMFTYAHYWEVTADFAGVDNCYHKNTVVEGPDDWPEIVLTSLNCYYDAKTNLYYYPCEGVTKDGYAHQYLAWYALCLKDGAAEWERLAEKNLDWDEHGIEHITCSDASGTEITEQDYDMAVERRFAGMEKSTLSLEWTVVENPAEEQTPVEPAATAAPTSSPRFKITKNPTSEALNVGGNTWFIAHADNGVAPVWLLKSPDDQLCTLDEAAAAHPGLKLEVLPKDTLAVSNVPLSLNGWGVVARFDGEGGSLYTEPAYLYVGDFITAYGSVIDKYRAAYESGNGDNPEYLWGQGISEMCAYSSGVGCALKDLDKDGTPELIIAGMGTEDFSENMVYALYTLANGSPLELAVSQARDRWYLRSDSLLLNEGSSGAAYSNVFVYAVKGGGLSGREGVLMDNANCYYQSGHCDFEPKDGDRSITLDEYTNTWNVWKSLCYMPPLTKIA